MAQIFPRSANAFAKASIFVALFLAGAGGFALWQVANSGYVTRQGIVLEQPVPFSHDHHVAQIGIDCHRSRFIPTHPHALAGRGSSICTAECLQTRRAMTSIASCCQTAISAKRT